MLSIRLAIYGTVIALAATSAAFAAETVELFNGKDLSGFKQRGGAAKYSVEDGVIVGRSVPDTSNTFLATEKEYGDFELELDFKIDDPTFNSGIQIRSHARPVKDGEQVYGYQVEIDPRTDRCWTGGIYFEGGDENRQAGWLNDLAKNEAARNAFKRGEWNHFKIVARGPHIETWINGVKAADFTDTDEKAFTPKGFIGLQVHSVGDKKEPMEVRWRNIKLTELDASADSASADGENTDGERKKVTGLQLFGKAVVAMFGLDQFGRRPGGGDIEEFAHLLGQPAPDFTLQTASGDTVKLADLRGKVVLLDFWASWCGPCMMAMPEVEKIHQEFAGKPVTVFGVNQQDDVATVNESIKDRELTFTQLLDTDGVVGSAFGANAIPHTVLIDAEGRIQKIHQGYTPTLAAELGADIEKLLRGEKLFVAKDKNRPAAPPEVVTQ